MIEWRKIKEERENAGLSAFAMRSSLSAGRLTYEEPCPIRTEYERDHHRILYSVDFRRLRHKTQVFFNAKNDHICTRMEHVLYVGAIAQTIARALNLNQDLAYAIALGHDLGHAPFGHTGERVLDKCVKKYNSSLGFRHETHSLRVVDRLATKRARLDLFGGEKTEKEADGRRGLNLTFEVRDGIACHCGEKYSEYELVPDIEKKPSRLYDTDIRSQLPATFEACVVRIVDKIAYVGRDIEDAHRAGIIGGGDIPKDALSELGFTNGQIINTLVSDIIENSYESGRIALSESKGQALERLINVNVNAIYQSEKIREYENSMSNTMEGLFDGLYHALTRGGEEGLRRADERVLRLFANFIAEQNKGHDTEKNTGTENSTYTGTEKVSDDAAPRYVLDFVAGMTDNFALQCYQELYWL